MPKTKHHKSIKIPLLRSVMRRRNPNSSERSINTSTSCSTRSSKTVAATTSSSSSETSLRPPPSNAFRHNNDSIVEEAGEIPVVFTSSKAVAKTIAGDNSITDPLQQQQPQQQQQQQQQQQNSNNRQPLHPQQDSNFIGNHNSFSTILVNNADRSNPRISNNQEDDDMTNATPKISNCRIRRGSSSVASSYGSSIVNSTLGDLDEEAELDFGNNNTTKRSNDGIIVSQEEDVEEEKQQQEPQEPQEGPRRHGIYRSSSRRRRKEQFTAFLNDIIIPSLVTVFYFSAFILSSYSSLSCKFVTCYLDFLPLNVNIQQTHMDIGPWAFNSPGSADDTGYKCWKYPSDFSNEFIENDSSWKLARVASVVGVLFGVIGCFILSLSVTRLNDIFFGNDDYNSENGNSLGRFCCSKLNTCFQILDQFWKWTVIIIIVLLLTFETVKFSFENVDMCQSEMWLRDDGKRVKAERCDLSTGAFCSICAIILYSFAAILLCYSHMLDTSSSNSDSSSLEGGRPRHIPLSSADNGEEGRIVKVKRDNYSKNVVHARQSRYHELTLDDDELVNDSEGVDSFSIDDTDLKELEAKQFTTTTFAEHSHLSPTSTYNRCGASGSQIIGDDMKTKQLERRKQVGDRAVSSLFEPYTIANSRGGDR